MTTFHLFPHLPAEIRIRIWELTVEPRIVEVRLRDEASCSQSDPYPKHAPYVLSLTPIPAPLHTCREARKLRLYQKAFSDLVVYNHTSQDLQRPYIWFNHDIDTISIGRDHLATLRGVEHLIKRLRLERDNYAAPWNYCGLPRFQNAIEIHVVLFKAGGDMRDWYRAVQDVRWPCGTENVTIVDPRDSRTSNLADMISEHHRELEEEYEEYWGDVGLVYTC
jgi:hypothetical protein